MNTNGERDGDSAGRYGAMKGLATMRSGAFGRIMILGVETKARPVGTQMLDGICRSEG